MTRSYGVIALVVPLIGLLLAGVQGQIGEIWITVAMVLTAVEVLSVLELLSVVVLLTNRATVHVDGVAAVLGPVHGALYLTVAVTALLGRGLLLRTRLMVLLPVLGGVLTLVNVRRESRR